MSRTFAATGGSVAAERIGQLHQHRHEHSAPRTPTPWPHQVGVIPSRAQWFQDRAETARLVRLLAGGGAAVVESADQVPAGGVLAGMGGVGKTQLAAHYARSAWHTGELDVLVWITASSRSAVVAGYVEAAAELLGAHQGDPELAARAFLAWLEPKPQQRVCRWLIVLDNVVDPGDLRGLWPPASPRGRTVVTTRRKDTALTAGGMQLIEIGLFTHAQALDYLAGALAAHGRVEPEQQLAALADDLGHLPLALSQAAAYLIDTSTSCRSYRTLLADRTRTLADAAPDALPDDQTHTVAAAWSLSLDRAESLRPVGLARPVLQLAAFLNPNGIPDAVLTGQPALTYFTQMQTGAAAVGTRPVTAEQVVLALAALRRLSLVDHTPAIDHQAVRVHQLIQRAVRDSLDPDQHDRLAHIAADALLAAWPEVERNTALAQTLRANTAALADCAGDALYRPDAHPVLHRAGRSLGESGQVAAARDHFRRLTTSAGGYLGPEHPETLHARSNLTYWLGEAGDVAGAAAACVDLVEDCLRVLGPDHPETLTARHQLARWLGEAGDVAGAAAACVDLVEDCLRVLGPDHPETLTARHQPARWLGQAGDAAGAAAAFADLVEDFMRVLGPDHPDTLTTRHQRARWLGQAGDAAGAAAAFADLLEDRIRVLGPDHPHTLTTRGNLAHWRGEAGDPFGAAANLADLVNDFLRVLGPDHPHTLTTRGNLAHWQGEAGDPFGAAAAFADLLEDRERILGPNHPHTLTTQRDLVHWRGRAGVTSNGSNRTPGDRI